MDCSLPGSSVQGVLEVRILEWVAIPFSRGPSQCRDWTWVSCIAGILYHLSHHGSPKKFNREIQKQTRWSGREDQWTRRKASGIHPVRGEKKKKRLRTSGDSLRRVWDTIKQNSIRLWGSQEEKKERKRQKAFQRTWGKKQTFGSRNLRKHQRRWI